MKSDRVFLTGFMGAGKSTIGPILANTLGWDFYDLDKMIENKTSKKITEIFQEHDEKYFRRLEEKTLLKLVNKRNVVIALGGGTMTFAANLEVLKRTGMIIYLKTSPESIYSRLKFKRDRPVLTGDGNIDLSKDEIMFKIKELLSNRIKYYELADLIINTDDFPVGKTVDNIARIINKNI